MSNTELLDVHGTNLRKLRDLKPVTLIQLLIVDASETPIKGLACNSEIGNRIVTLNARSCSLTSLIGLSSMKNLVELNVGDNQLKSISSEREDSSAPSLQRLLADHNEISDNDSSFFGSLSFSGFPLLVHLDLSNNHLERLGFVSTIGQHLKSFKLSNNRIGDLCELSHLHSLCNVEEVELNGNPVTDVLSDYKLLILTKAIILGNLMTVNGVVINGRDELLAEGLHFQGVRRFKPGNYSNADVIAFIKAAMVKVNSQHLESISSQQNKGSARSYTSYLAPKDHNATPARRPFTTPSQNKPQKRCQSMIFTTPRNASRSGAAHPIQRLEIEETASSSNASVLQSEFQQRLDKVFSTCEAQQKRIESLESDNKKLQGIVAQQATKIDLLEDQLSVVPTNLRVRKGKGSMDADYVLEWDNHLKAMYNVKKYQLNLGGENQTYDVRAPYQRAVINNPINGQKIFLRAIHRTNGKSSSDQEFTIKLPGRDADNKENHI